MRFSSQGPVGRRFVSPSHAIHSGEVEPVVKLLRARVHNPGSRHVRFGTVRHVDGITPRPMSVGDTKSDRSLGEVRIDDRYPQPSGPAGLRSLGFRRTMQATLALHFGATLLLKGMEESLILQAVLKPQQRRRRGRGSLLACSRKSKISPALWTGIIRGRPARLSAPVSG